MKVRACFGIFAGLLLLLTKAACADEPIEVPIGVIGPLTGETAVWGTDFARVTELLEEDFNKAQVKYHFHFIREDGKCGAGSAAIPAAKKLVSIDKIHFLITACSGETLQVGKFAESERVLTIAMASIH